MHSGQFQYVLTEAPRCFSESVVTEEKVWEAITACKAAGAIGQWGKAIYWAEQGLGLPETSDEAFGLLSFLYGTAQMYSGDPRKAEDYLQRFLSVAGRTPKLAPLLPDSLLNLGYVMRFLGKVAEERRFLREAAVAYAGAGRFRQEALSHLDLAWAELHRSEPDLAERSVAQATLLLPEHGDSELRIKQQLCLAFLQHLRAGYTESNQLCEQLLFDPDLTPAQEADVAWILGRTAACLSDMEMARKWAERAYECALKDWWPLQLAYVEELRRSVIGSSVGR
ncbi:MAG TPA: hypothetical protein VNT01_07525 [Symbiobacteriaceae bacterium]|nr:hypothetical protein [Symbiobacteriaceae bacterium]